MIYYLKKAKAALEPFKYYMIKQIPRDSTFIADALVEIASSLDSDASNSILVRYFEVPNISSPDQIIATTESISWMTPII